MRNGRADLNDTPDRDRSIRRPRRRLERRPGEVPSWAPKRTLPAVLLAVLLTVIAAGCVPGFSGGSGPVFPALSARGLPANPDSIELTVSAPDMETVSRTIDPGDSSITLEVPAGAAREFNLAASNVSVTTSGSTVQDLTAGTSVEISIPLKLSGTEIIVPDGSNSRIVQIDDMSGAGWNTLLNADLGVFSYNFNPAEIDFDDSGRIYAALTGELSAVVALDHIDATSYEMFVPQTVTVDSVSYSTRQVIAVDRENGLLYVPADAGGNLYVLAFSTAGGTAPQSIYDLSSPSDIGTTLTSSQIKAMGVDSSGKLYLIGSPDGSLIYKLDLAQPVGSRVVDSVSFFDFNPTDMIVKDDKIYVGGTIVSPAGGKIRRYDLNLNQEGSDITGKADTTDEFWGIAALLIHPGGGFLIADTDGQVSRLVAFDDFTTTGWQTFSPSDIGESGFLF